MGKIAENISSIKATLPSGVTLVAVSKFHPTEAILEAYNSGQRIFGESRVQELVAKHATLPQDIEWQMIGHLQTNKVRAIVPFISLIQSVDSARLSECINREAERVGRTIDILLEIRVAQEESKSGWEYPELLDFLHRGAVAEMKNLRVRGVMGMATNTDDEARIRADFEQLAQYKKELAPMFDASFDTLSMGMSDDYALAVECGSTMVRVGSSIFGVREY
ncbi:MAG: YggS family pyridoxal phosphate-dependent enzyme [Alistipes sp.]|nr:YggS family pyridoxal phosphate-dependent enzyme [Alistipes sp.]